MSARSLPYLLSVALVLLGGYVELYGGGPTTSVTKALSGVMLYETLLLLGAAYLFRARGEAREPLPTVAILVLFLLDLPMVQQRFGWAAGPGRVVATVSFATSCAFVVALAVALKLPLASRMLGTLVASIAFLRFGPILLDGAVEPAWGVVPGFVFLGWLAAGCLLSIVFLESADRVPSRLPVARMEELVVGACLTAVLGHFLVAGVSVALRFRVLYLAPFLILLGPALEKLVPVDDQNRARRLLIAVLPCLGLAVSAIEPTGTEGLGTFTPFSLALALTILVTLARARRSDLPELWHAVAGLVCTAILARELDLPEVLARLLYPEAWQVVAVSFVVWGTILVWRDFRCGLVLQLVAAIPISAQISDLGYPFAVAFALVVAWSVVTLLRITGVREPRALVVGPAIVLALAPAAALLADRTSGIALLLFAAESALGFFVGRWGRDRVLSRSALAGLLLGGLSYLLLELRLEPVPIGTLLTRLGLAAFLFGILRSLFGQRIRDRLASLVRSFAPAGE